MSKIYDLRGHISNFQAENKTKIGPFKAENNALKSSEQLQTNFEKVKKTTFLKPKFMKSRVPFLATVPIFWNI